MSDLTKANIARLQKLLNEKREFSHGCDTFGAMIARGDFSRAEQEQAPRVRWNRRHANNLPNWEAQDEYEKRCAQLKTVYKLYRSSDTEVYIYTNKMIYNFFVSQQKKATVEEQKHDDNY